MHKPFFLKYFSKLAKEKRLENRKVQKEYFQAAHIDAHQKGMLRVKKKM